MRRIAAVTPQNAIQICLFGECLALHAADTFSQAAFQSELGFMAHAIKPVTRTDAIN